MNEFLYASDPPKLNWDNSLNRTVNNKKIEAIVTQRPSPD